MLKFLVIVAVLLGVTLVFARIKNHTAGNLTILSPISKTFSFLAFAGKREAPSKTVYGYLPYWSINEYSSYLQLDKLTDIAYFGLHIQEDGNFLTQEDGELNPGYNHWKNNEKLDQLIRKANHEGVNFALTIISHRDDVSDKFLDCRSCWDTLADNIIAELIEKDITDVNLNFEYVEYTPKAKARQYTEFTDFLNKRLDAEFGDSKVVVASFADSAVEDRVTEIEGIAKVADQIFIMAYDFHRPSSDTAGPVAPLGGIGVHADYDIETMLRDYLAYVPPNKLLLGVPYYGYNWVVESDIQYAKRIEGHDSIGYSQSQTYEQIMANVVDLKPDLKWDELAKTPYFTYLSPETGSLREVYFDNTDSLRFKYDLVHNHNLGGVGIWALGYDGGYHDLWNLLDLFFIQK